MCALLSCVGSRVCVWGGMGGEGRGDCNAPPHLQRRGDGDSLVSLPFFLKLTAVGVASLALVTSLFPAKRAKHLEGGSERTQDRGT